MSEEEVFRVLDPDPPNKGVDEASDGDANAGSVSVSVSDEMQI